MQWPFVVCSGGHWVIEMMFPSCRDPAVDCVCVCAVCVGCRQVSGRGRGANGWISPRGSLSVTIRLKYDPLPRYLVFVQYVAGLAMVEAIRTVAGYEALPLRVKWPNDIYYCDTEGSVSSGSGSGEATVWEAEHAIKLGGVLVTASSMGSAIDVFVGVGLNVNNPRPTVSLAQVVERWALEHGCTLAPLSVEYVLGRFLTKFEALIDALAVG